MQANNFTKLTAQIVIDEGHCAPVALEIPSAAKT